MASENGTKVLFCRRASGVTNRSPGSSGIHNNNIEVMTMWTKPAYNDLRIGFEVTMYINNR